MNLFLISSMNKDPRFAGLRGVRDCVAQKLREDGIGASVTIINPDEEMQL